MKYFQGGKYLNTKYGALMSLAKNLDRERSKAFQILGLTRNTKIRSYLYMITLNQ